MPALELIQRLQALDHPSQAQKQVATFLEVTYRDVPFLTVAEMAKSVGVSKATVTRFIQRLGYESLAELKGEVRAALYTPDDSPAERIQAMNRTPDISRVLETYKQRELSNLQQTLQRLDTTSVRALCEKLIRAQRIWVYGQRFSYGLAFNLGLLLAQLLPSVLTVSGEAGTSADHFARARPSDYVLIVAHRRLGAEKVALTAFLNDKGVPYSLITDAQRDDPICLHADHVFQTVTDAVGAFNCYASSYAVIQALASALEVCAPSARDCLSESEVALQRFRTFTPTRGGPTLRKHRDA